MLVILFVLHCKRILHALHSIMKFTFTLKICKTFEKSQPIILNRKQCTRILLCVPVDEPIMTLIQLFSIKNISVNSKFNHI